MFWDESDAVTNPEKDTAVRVEDTEGGSKALQVPLSADTIVLESYCKVFQFLGLGWVSLLPRGGYSPLISSDAHFDRIRGESVLFLFEILGLRVGLLESVAKALFNKEIKGLHQRVNSALLESSLVRGASEAGSDDLLSLPNGVVGIPL